MYSLEIFCFEIYVCFVLFIILYYIIENSKITEINSNFARFYAMRKKSGYFSNGRKRSAGMERRNIVYISGDELRMARRNNFLLGSLYRDGFLDVVSKCQDKSRNAHPISTVILV